ncbi:flowering time control protein FPA [Iris pallida]|uniref:Flowering time control protein FPA n=1 Tax=Iris pallida TaxID=29817 RepID=A0AAX6EFI4_IRIPA|nr:flowering time control protein FPA [Iris pallida]
MPPASSSSRRSRGPPPRASTDLWVGNLSPDTSISDLMAVFFQFSPLDATPAFSRTYAFVMFRSPSDAARAKASLSASMQIEFARPPKPGKHLWVGGLAPSADEALLRDKFSEFGTVAGFALARARNSAFLDFATTDEAVAAKQAMDGRRVAGATVRVDFQRPFQWTKGKEEPMSNTLWVGYPASVRMDTQMLHNAMILFGEIEKIKSFPERNYCFVEFRSVDEARRAKEGLQGRLFGDPRIQIMFSCSDYGAGKDGMPPLLPGFPWPEMLFGNAGLLPPPFGLPGPGMRLYLPQGFDPDFGEPTWTRPSPGPGLMPTVRPTWDDGFDTREPKRSRIYGISPIDDEPFHGHNVSGRGLVSPELRHIWRGVIAKGGSHVCHARCVPIGKGIDNPLPEVVNCSARTDLDVLAKHCAEAIGFDVVFFIPDSEDDFASYTEFLRYLGLKSRAGVAKFDDGTTMFLVPPSDFLTEFLKVSGPERLYGVVLRLAQQPATVTPPRPQAATLPSSHYGELQGGSTSQDGYGYVPQNEDPTLRKDYGSNMRESSISRSGDGEPHAMPSGSHDYRRNTEATSQVQLSLTPELIATLASLIPTSNQSSVSGNIQMASSSTAKPSSFPATEMDDSLMFAQQWGQDHQVTYSAAQLEMANNTQQQLQQLQQFGQHKQLQQSSHQHDNQPPVVSQYTPYSNLANGPDNSGQSFLGSAQGHDLGLNMPRASYDSYNTHGTLNAPDAGVVHSFQYQSALPNSSAEGQAGRVLQTQAGTVLHRLPSPSDNADYSAKMQQLQMALNNHGDGPSQGIGNKNQRYQSTLQFAASLLQGIRQQQQGSNQTVDGSGNQL